MMNSLTLHEQKAHGTAEFPVEYFYIDSTHPRYNMPFHWHKEWELIHVLEGSFTAQADDTTYTATAGDTLLIRDGMLHGGTPENCIYECFLFDLHGLFRHLDMVKKYLRPVYRKQILPQIFYPASQTPEINALVHRLTLPYHKQQSVSASTTAQTAATTENIFYENPLELVVISCISHLFSYILQNSYYTDNTEDFSDRPHKIDLIKSVLEYTERHYNSPITLNELAAVAGMNPRYFCRFFRSITHQTPIEYVNMYRIEKAAQMLHNTRLPITAICMECGFNDSSNFIKVFRKYKGTTPNQYRKG